MNTLIIYCHPHGESHNRRILGAVERGLAASGTAYEIVDLQASGFEPRLQAVEYERLFIRREAGAEPDVAALQARVREARNLVFIYPVWWYTAPAALKGFLDRVFTAGFAYRFRRLTWLLKAGGTKHHSELLAPFGLDASDPTFWSRGLGLIASMIDELEAMEA